MIFIDANFLISLFAETEEEHDIALNIWDRIKDDEIIISNSIILEVMNILNIKVKISTEDLKRIYNKLNSGLFKIIEDTYLYDDAVKRMISYYPQRLPLFNCLYIELMEQLEIKKIATFDKHFNNKGLELLNYYD